MGGCKQFFVTSCPLRITLCLLKASFFFPSSKVILAPGFVGCVISLYSNGPGNWENMPGSSHNTADSVLPLHCTVTYTGTPLLGDSDGPSSLFPTEMTSSLVLLF